MTCQISAYLLYNANNDTVLCSHRRWVSIETNPGLDVWGPKFFSTHAEAAYELDNYLMQLEYYDRVKAKEGRYDPSNFHIVTATFIFNPKEKL